jgi:hypothetical protein
MIDPDFDPLSILQDTAHNLEALSGQVAHLAHVLEVATQHLQALERRYVDIQFMCSNLNSRLNQLEPQDD